VPLVFLHHFTAVLDDWDPRVIDGIAAKRHVIAFDNRGIGASGGSVPHTIDEMAADAVAFIRTLGYNKVDLLGFSLGGGVAQEITLEHPELVHRVILAGTGPAGGGGIEKINRIAATAYTKAALTFRDPRHFLFFNRNPAGKRAATDYMARLKERTQHRDKRISLQARRAQLKAIRAAGLQAPPRPREDQPAGLRRQRRQRRHGRQQPLGRPRPAHPQREAHHLPGLRARRGLPAPPGVRPRGPRVPRELSDREGVSRQEVQEPD
jgi:pimeloyl-ACP methyl ester carboxylesterase